MKYGKNHGNWKGSEIKYFSLHTWMKRTYGLASICENNNTHIGRFQWANISGKYKRERKDFKMLCVSCHRLFDYEKKYGNKCKRGHEFTKENTYMTKSGWRACIICKKEAIKSFYKAHPLKKKEYARKDYLKHKKQIRIKQKEYRQKIKNDNSY